VDRPRWPPGPAAGDSTTNSRNAPTVIPSYQQDHQDRLSPRSPKKEKQPVGGLRGAFGVGFRGLVSHDIQIIWRWLSGTHARRDDFAPTKDPPQRSADEQVRHQEKKRKRAGPFRQGGTLSTKLGKNAPMVRLKKKKQLVSLFPIMRRTPILGTPCSFPEYNVNKDLAQRVFNPSSSRPADGNSYCQPSFHKNLLVTRQAESSPSVSGPTLPIASGFSTPPRLL